MRDDIPLAVHLAELRVADQRYYDERDRRYAEVNIEREKALKIKERADEVALGLAREIQTYKDERANNLRSQIEGERGDYATKAELKPIAEYVAANTGHSAGVTDARALLFSVLIVIAGVAAVISPHIK